MSSAGLLVALRWSVIACLAHLCLLTASYLALLAFGVVEEALRRREEGAEDFDALASSRFTIPVSVICPAYNEEKVILEVVRSVLAFDYPEFELIVVNDGSSDGTVELLRRELGLSRVEVFPRRVLEATPPRALYRGPSQPRLTVVDKENGGKADALNCGVNLARYRYLCFIDGDTVYEKDALLRSMRSVLQDPAHVLGATSHVGVEPPPAPPGAPGRAWPSASGLLVRFQDIEYLRSFLNSRLGWSRLNFMLCAPGAFSLWRRDTVVELGGFSRAFTCEDIEFTFRVHERELREGRDYRILSLPHTVCRTEVPARAAQLLSQRERWQRVTLETLWHYRRMFLNPRYGAAGLLGFPFYLLAEAIAPFFGLLAAATLVGALAVGAFSLPEWLLVLGIVSFGTSLFTTAALLLGDLAGPKYAFGDLVRMALLGPFEVVLYRPLVSLAGLVGTWGFLRGDKSWRKLARNVRPAGPAPPG